MKKQEIIQEIVLQVVRDENPNLSEAHLKNMARKRIRRMTPGEKQVLLNTWKHIEKSYAAVSMDLSKEILDEAMQEAAFNGLADMGVSSSGEIVFESMDPSKREKLIEFLESKIDEMSSKFERIPESEFRERIIKRNEYVAQSDGVVAELSPGTVEMLLASGIATGEQGKTILIKPEFMALAETEQGKVAVFTKAGLLKLKSYYDQIEDHHRSFLIQELLDGSVNGGIEP